MDKDTALEALQQAACNEEETRQFYLEVAQRTIDQRGREMFLSLAEEEEVHLRTVKAQYEALQAGRGWVVFEELPPCEPTALEIPLSARARELLAKEVRADASDLDALLLGMQIEHKSYDFYQQAAAQTTDPDGKALYQSLAAAERTHFDVLMLNYEHMLSTGTWLGLTGKDEV